LSGVFNTDDFFRNLENYLSLPLSLCPFEIFPSSPVLVINTDLYCPPNLWERYVAAIFFQFKAASDDFSIFIVFIPDYFYPSGLLPLVELESGRFSFLDAKLKTH